MTPNPAPALHKNHHGGLALAASGRLRSCNHANGNALIFGCVFRDGWRLAPALHDVTPDAAPSVNENHHVGLALAASGRLRSCNRANGNALIFGRVFRDGWRLAPALHDVTPDAAPSVNENHHGGLALAASGRLRSCNHANGNALIFGCVFRDGWRLAPALHDVTPDAAPSVNENHHGGLALAASGRLRSCNHANGNALIFGCVFRDGWRLAPA